jgi:predicted RNA-binding protein (virulence factor B family)
LAAIMTELGRKHTLSILREATPGLYLDGLEHGEILLPGKYKPEGAAPGDMLEVFLHHDSEDRLVATTQTPFVTLGKVAGLEVVGIRSGVGAFLDWGLEKDLLLPLREQTRTVQKGEWVVAMALLDEVSGRLMASMRLHRHLHKTEPAYKEGEAVDLVVAEETDLGYKCAVNHAHWGLLYKTEVGSPLVPGDEMQGYIKSVRPDGKIDLSLDGSGYSRIAPLAGQILKALEASEGPLPFHDKSDPEGIRAQFGASKKAFKQALGTLLKEGKISLTESGIQKATAPRTGEAPPNPHRSGPKRQRR